MTPHEWQKLLMGIAGYEYADCDPQSYASLFGWDPDDPTVIERWTRYHNLYMELWKTYGWEWLDKALEPGRQALRRFFGR